VKTEWREGFDQGYEVGSGMHTYAMAMYLAFMLLMGSAIGLLLGLPR
jgi:hypothetical protein